MHNNLTKDVPRFDLELLFDEIGVLLDENQYRDAISLVDMYHFYTRQHQVGVWFLLLFIAVRTDRCHALPVLTHLSCRFPFHLTRPRSGPYSTEPPRHEHRPSMPLSHRHLNDPPSASPRLFGGSNRPDLPRSVNYPRSDFYDPLSYITFKLSPHTTARPTELASGPLLVSEIPTNRGSSRIQSPPRASAICWASDIGRSQRTETQMDVGISCHQAGRQKRVCETL